MAKLQVEIAICTWNRARQLDETLSRFADLQNEWSKLNIAGWRLIVVDNNSTDATPHVVQSFSNRFEIEYLHEPQQGHVFARNRAIESMRGDLLLWTDDDVTVSQNWMNAYVCAALDQPKESFWGSKIVPRFEGQKHPPRWILDNWSKLSGCFAARDLGDSVLALDATKLPYGANFAIRTAVQKEFRFSQYFGRSRHAIVGEDELDLFRRLLEAGHRGQWLPDAPVEHRIDTARMTPGFVADYFEGQGRALVAQNQAWSNDPVALLREARHELFWGRVKRYISVPDVWVSHLVRGSLAKGQAKALLENQNASPDRSN